MPRVVEGDYQIKPSDIRLDGWLPLASIFGHRETEEAAIFIIRMCLLQNRWGAFTHQELDAAFALTPDGQHKEQFDWTYRMLPPPEVARHLFSFCDLVAGGMVVLGSDGKYRVTDAFIHRCFQYGHLK